MTRDHLNFVATGPDTVTVTVTEGARFTFTEPIPRDYHCGQTTRITHTVTVANGDRVTYNTEPTFNWDRIAKPSGH